MMPRLASRLPPDFVWGVATSAYQIEGSPAADGKGESIWDRFVRLPGRIERGETGDVACDHYRRWREDVELMAALGVGAYRFSIAWSRVQPAGAGAVNDAGLDFYDRLVDALLERGIRPVVTLYHWDLPQALQERGGWASRGVVERFADYADVAARRLGDRVADWITLNEPQVFAFQGHGTGEHAPGLTDWPTALRAAHHAHLAHRAAHHALRARIPGVRVGITLNLSYVEPATEAEPDRRAAVRLDGASNRWFLDPSFGRPYPADLVEAYADLLEGIDLAEAAGTPAPDFLGVNYYTRDLARADPAATPLGVTTVTTDVPRTEMGWEIYPAGLTELLVRVHRDYGPRSVLVTENGAAFPDEVRADGSIQDEARRAFIKEHVAALGRARQAGAPVDGYFVWSLLDNFEWARGYRPRFGVVRVDFETQRRTVKRSGRWYAELISRSGG